MSRLCGQRGPRGPNKGGRTEAQKRRSRADRAARDARMTEERGIQISLTRFASAPLVDEWLRLNFLVSG